MATVSALALAACSSGSEFDETDALPQSGSTSTEAPIATTSTTTVTAPATPGLIETGDQLCAFFEVPLLLAQVDAVDLETSTLDGEAADVPTCALTMRGVDGVERGQVVMTTIADDFDQLVASAPPSADNPRLAGLGDRAVLSRVGPSVFIDAGGLLWLVAARDAPDLDGAEIESVARSFLASLGGRSVVYDPLVPEPLAPGPDAEPADPAAGFCAVYDEANGLATPSAPVSTDLPRQLAAAGVAVLAVEAPAELAEVWPTYREGLLRLFTAFSAPGTTQWDAITRLEAWDGFDAFGLAFAVVEGYVDDNCPSS